MKDGSAHTRESAQREVAHQIYHDRTTFSFLSQERCHLLHILKVAAKIDIPWREELGRQSGCAPCISNTCCWASTGDVHGDLEDFSALCPYIWQGSTDCLPVERAKFIFLFKNIKTRHQKVIRPKALSLVHHTTFSLSHFKSVNRNPKKKV